MKVTAILKGPKDSEGRRKVYVRVNEGEKRTFKATKIKVATSQFSKGRVRGHKDADHFNLIIKQQIVKIENEKITGTTSEVKPTDFFKYCYACLSEWEKEKKESTILQYKAEITKIKAFKPTFSLPQVNVDFLKGYKKYCEKKGNKENTLWKTFKFLRTIMIKAHAEQLILENPFKRFAMPKYQDPEKMFLTKKEIDLFIKQGSTLATWFAIGCYTGLRFSDMTKFDLKRHIRDGRIIIRTQKTGDTISMPVSERLKELFERVEYKPLSVTNQHYNRELKQMSKDLKIDKPVTGHSSRHSFGVMCADAGISQEVTARLMGHKDLSTTAIYYKITNPRIDREIEKLG